MYEPKVIDFITTNGKHIMLYEYLKYEFTLKLANDLVVGVDPKSDQVDFLVPDENGVYCGITSINTSKPTAQAAELLLEIRDVWKIDFYKNGIFIKNDYPNTKDINYLNFHYHQKEKE